jgi:predicted nucleic acid-binding Zn finger protein
VNEIILLPRQSLVVGVGFGVHFGKEPEFVVEVEMNTMMMMMMMILVGKEPEFVVEVEMILVGKEPEFVVEVEMNTMMMMMMMMMMMILVGKEPEFVVEVETNTMMMMILVGKEPEFVVEVEMNTMMMMMNKLLCAKRNGHTCRRTTHLIDFPSRKILTRKNINTSTKRMPTTVAMCIASGFLREKTFSWLFNDTKNGKRN